MKVWEPYFKPTRRVHDSGFRCFECGYLQIGDGHKVEKKVILGVSVDHISNWLFNGGPLGEGTSIDMDLLRDGHIRVFNNNYQLFWSLPGWSDAGIVAHPSQACPSYAGLDEMYEYQKENEK